MDNSGKFFGIGCPFVMLSKRHGEGLGMVIQGEENAMV
jgi:hypothetical protein